MVIAVKLKKRRNSVVPLDLADEMDRVYAGALAVIARHRGKPVETAQPPTRTAPGAGAPPAAHRVAPPAAKVGRIGLETRFRKIQGRTRITPGSLRAKALEAMPCSLAELASALGGEGAARGVIGKLREAGWLEIVSDQRA